MSKLDQIIANNARGPQVRRKSGLLTSRGRVMLLTLTSLLVLFVFLTQPPVREAVDRLIGMIAG